jgi:hypothetical protein
MQERVRGGEGTHELTTAMLYLELKFQDHVRRLRGHRRRRCGRKRIRRLRQLYLWGAAVSGKGWRVEMGVHNLDSCIA